MVVNSDTHIASANESKSWQKLLNEPFTIGHNVSAHIERLSQFERH